LNFDYESVRKYNLRIIYCSITKYGQFGVLAGKAGHDINFMSCSGVLDTMSRSTGIDISQMVFPPFQLSDVVGGLNSVI
jgi:alpha-methylacyl-CoA racemase